MIKSQLTVVNIALFVFGGVVLTSCSKSTTPSNISFVNPKSVRSILLARTPAEQAQCSSELLRQGAAVLYESATGAIFTDHKLADLDLSNCEAISTTNDTFDLGDEVRGEASENPVEVSSLIDLIPAEKIGARSFIQKNPTFDGRGAIIAVLDTGVEVDHKMLTTTSTGERKVIATLDLSGEGQFDLVPISVKKESFKSPKGTAYKAAKVVGTDFRFGIFKGSSLAHSDNVSGVDKFQDLGVLVYKTKTGFVGRVDINNDKDFANDNELADYSVKGDFIKLGEKQTLTATLSISEDASSASLFFDDGGHGTHVAGISAGNDPTGLKGVAPGAQVIGAKIGDNRLSGGSTTTASMLMAIDFAVSKGANIINLSYGIRAGSNTGNSTIDTYVDKVALEKGILFSVSAGNEGPGLLTVGTPAGARLAITNGAFLSRDTAHANYSYLNVERDLLWYFSSIGPLFDGGFKPTLIAPGTALSSKPSWDEGLGNHSGTSMASPQVTGGLALLVSAAKQSNLPADRATVTQAVYQSADHIEHFSLIEQGHGLMNVPAAFDTLQTKRNSITVEYELSVNSSTAPNGKGSGIYVRSSEPPANLFSVKVSPSFPKDTPKEAKNALKTYQLKPSAQWISTPKTFFLLGSTRAFEADLDSKIFSEPGLHSEKIEALDEKTGEVAFTVPVTIVVPNILDVDNQYTYADTFEVQVGEVARTFVSVPAGATALQVDLVSDGPMAWMQLLDSEGREVLKLTPSSRTSPQEPLLGQANVVRPGVYEIDVVSPAYNQKRANVQIKVRAFSLQITQGPPTGADTFELFVANAYNPLNIKHAISLPAGVTQTTQVLTDSKITIPFKVTEDDKKTVSEIAFRVRTAKALYDQMTDYPYYILDPEKHSIDSGGLQLDSSFSVTDLADKKVGTYTLVIAGAFTKEAPKSWAFELTQKRVLQTPISILSGVPHLLEQGQQTTIPVDLSRHQEPLIRGMENCLSLELQTPSGRLIQSKSICR